MGLSLIKFDTYFTDKSNDMSVNESASKKILFLTKEANSLTSTAQFLSGRDWEVGRANQLREAIAYLIQNMPQYVVIAADHPHPKVKVLPSILQQAFGVHVLVYVETPTVAAIAALKTLEKYAQILPPISGPAVERALNKLTRDATQAAAQRSIHRSSLSSTGSDSESEHLIISSQSSAKEALAQLFGGEGNSESDLAGLIRNSSLPNLQAKQNATPSTEQGISESFAEYEERMAREKQGQLDDPTPTGSNPKNSPGEPKEFKPISAGRNPNFDGYINGEDPQSPNNKIDLPIPQPKSGVAFIAPAPRPGEKLQYNQTYAGQKNKSGVESLIVKGAKEALEASTVKESTKPQIETLQKSQNAICIMIESSRFNGYLVAALGKNRRLDDEFIYSVQNRLYTFLKNQGETLRQEETLDIKLKPVDFEGWALEEAEFLRKSIHKGDEVAMAFFPTRNLKQDLRESHQEDMVQFFIDDLKPDTPVLFDVYIYLPANNKYILYTPQGGVFLSQQKDRLKSKGVFSLHMRKNQVSDLKRYQAQNYLNEKITDFENKEAKKKAS